MLHTSHIAECTYVYKTLQRKKTHLYKSGLANNYIAPFLMLLQVPGHTSPSASLCLPLFHDSIKGPPNFRRELPDFDVTQSQNWVTLEK